jgi:uncharacterized protein YigA (DUF484 family)
MGLKAEDVAQYLKSNPDFFEQHVTLLEEIYLPHPHGGRTVSISERQQLILREKNKLLENKLKELVQFAEENETIGEKVHRFSLALIHAGDTETLLDTLYFQLRDTFSIPHVALRLWGGEALPGRAEFSGVGEELEHHVDSLSRPSCGALSHGVAAWFGEGTPALQSCAMVALRADGVLGLLVLASEDPKRFYPEMGDLYLRRMGELISAALARLLR